MPNIILRNISKTFKIKTGPKTVLSQINLEIPDQSCVVLVGASGAGKSTLLNIIGGLELPTTGEILVDHQDVNQLKSAARTDFYRKKVGFVSQDFYLQPQLTLTENISLPGIFANLNTAESTERVRELAEMLEITDVLTCTPEAISDDQARRTCIARALFMHPQIILADEPADKLDVDKAHDVVEILQELWQKTKATMIITSQDEKLFPFATKILRIADGHVTELGDTPTPNAEIKIDYETIPTN